MKWHIDYAAIQEEFRKLGIILIAGGIVGLAFDKKIDAFTAAIAIIGGMSLIILGVLRQDEKKEDEIDD